MVGSTKIYSDVKVTNHRFSVATPALAANATIYLIYNKTIATTVIVLGKGICKDKSDQICLEVPLVGQASVIVKKAGGAEAKQWTVVVNPKTASYQVPVPEILASGSVEVPIPKLSESDEVQIVDKDGNVKAGPLVARGAKPATKCTAKSNLPCLNPVKATDKNISGFAAKGSTVEIEVNSVKKGQVAVESADQSFTFELSSLAAGQKVTVAQISPAPAAGAKPQTVTVTAAPTPQNNVSLYTLGLVGVNMTGSTATSPAAQYFVSFDTRLALPFLGNRVCSSDAENQPLDRKCWVWMNPRIASAPAPSSAALTSFSSPASLATGAGGQTLAQITQTFEFQAGLEYSLFSGPRISTGSTAFKGNLSAIVGGGIVTPFNSVSNASEFALNTNLGAQFMNNSVFAQTYPILAQALCGTTYGYQPTAGCTPLSTTFKNVAFVLPNRSRFFVDYFVGLRLRTFFFSGNCKDSDGNQDDSSQPASSQPSDNQSGDDQSATQSTSSCKLANTYPGTFDIRFGQDDTVTAGALQHFVMTIAGSYPLPGTAGAVRLFGSTYIGLRHNRNTPALALLATSPAVPVTDPSVVIQPILPSDHDYFRIGLGVDLVPIITKWAAAKSTSSTGSTNTSTTPSK